MEFLVILTFPIYSLLTGCHAYFGPAALSCASSNFKNKNNPTTSHLNKVIASAYVIIMIGLPLLLTSVINITIGAIVHYSGSRVGAGTPKSTLVTLASITWVFILSYSLAIANSVWDRFGSLTQPMWWEALVLSMMGLNVVANPIIYLVTNTSFRRFVVNSVTEICTGNRKRFISSGLLPTAMLTTAAIVASAREKIVKNHAQEGTPRQNLKMVPLNENTA